MTDYIIIAVIVLYALITLAVIKGSEIENTWDAIKVVFWPITFLIQIISGE